MNEKSASEQIDDIIAKHGGWKAEVLTQLRAIINASDPAIVEEVKWKMANRPEGLPVWAYGGIVCFTEIWKDNVKLLFPKGADLKDSHRLFNARLKSKDIRAIEFREGNTLNKSALEALVIKAVALNSAK